MLEAIKTEVNAHYTSARWCKQKDNMMKSSKTYLFRYGGLLLSRLPPKASVPATFKGPVGVQIYSLRNQLKQDRAKALDVLKDLNAACRDRH